MTAARTGRFDLKLSAPIYRLKRQARILARRQNIPHHQALNLIAQQQGFDSWSLLAKRWSKNQIGRSLVSQLQEGDLLLLGARPGHGKTLLGLEMAIAAMNNGHNSTFFSLDYIQADVEACFRALDTEMQDFSGRFAFDGSDDICASYIAERLDTAPAGTVALIDYLQLLDQKRRTPALEDQIQFLKAFARTRGLIFVFISQIDRGFDTEERSIPGLADVRLPNPLDLALFNKSCFLNRGEIELQARA